jgi:hypothetical protein
VTAIGNDGPVAIEAFAAGSSGDAKPVTAIIGPNTGIQNAFGIAVDPKGTLFATTDSGAEHTGVLAFPRSSDGNVTSSAIISGDQTGIDSPAGVALDPRGDIYVADAGRYKVGRDDFSAGIRVFSAGSNGNVPPIATISGSNTGLDGRTVRGIAVDSDGNIYVTSDGCDSMCSSITIFKAGSNGNVKPRAVIAGDKTGLHSAGGIAIGPYGDRR